MNLLQWNVNDFQTRRPDLQALILYRDLPIICLEETYLRPSLALTCAASRPIVTIIRPDKGPVEERLSL
jgi:hypothetical protein